MHTFKKLFALVLSFMIISCKTDEKTYNQEINITPKPMELSVRDGKFTLKSNTIFVVKDEPVRRVADFFISKIQRSTGYSLLKQQDRPSSNYIDLSIVADLKVNDEGYTVDVAGDGISVKATTPQGIFYGLQTVMQLLPAEIESPDVVKISWTIPNVSIKDEPRFKYRGQHLDVCRHFVDVEHIKKQLDVMAMFKINKFHWHLTDDQGWRIESKKYPKLNSASTVRTESEGNIYGPYYYTHQQIREIVAYAGERFIEVIPEVELPGHAVAALSAYPEYSCTGGTFEVRNVWGVANDVFCAGNDATFAFLTDIIEEVIPLFRSDYFHIGGDECPKGRWEKCPKCQERIKKEKLKDEHELQSWFIRRIEKVLIQHNKKMIGWDEILEGGLAPSATVMSWRGEKGGLDAANMGHDAIMTPGGWLYLDHYQGDPKVEPVTIGGYTTLEKTYSYEPVPEGIDSDKAKHILGAQANVWTEYIYAPEQTEYMAYPRAIALAEVTWSRREQKDYRDFERRIANQLVRLDGHHINYHIPIPEQPGSSSGFIAFIDSATVELKTTRPVKIIYTTGMEEPAARNSKEYTAPLKFSESTVLKVRSVLPSGKMSVTRTIYLDKQTYAPATATEAASDMKVEYYRGKYFKASELEGKTPDEIEHVESMRKVKYRIPDYREVYDDDYCSVVLTGYFHVPENGIYCFSTAVDGLWIDGKLFIDNEGTVRKNVKSDKSIALAKGYHSVKIVRLGNIIGGWPSQWDAVSVIWKKADQQKFAELR
ncbi:MAG: family 20 glycosylhydrolase [Prevotellaceae bacterium]|jgi:hexosaminidase|nr:family 20 glycosylhydrolase [Prevotellaceae bacterium]